MMEVAVESPQPAWEQFKEEVEIMEEEDGGAAAAAGELLTREIKKRLLDHAHENGNGAQVSGGEEEELKAAAAEEEEEEEEAPEEPKVAEEEQQRHKSIFFDAAKGLWKCRHCDWTYCLASPCGNGIIDHRGYRHQIEQNLESLVEEGSFYGSPNKEHSTVESPLEDQAAADSAMMPLQSKTQCPNDTTTTTESSASYIHHSHGTVVKPEHSTVESSSEHQTTTTTTTTTTTATATSSSTTTSEAANTSSHTSSAIDGHKSVATTIENGSFTTHASHTAEVKVDGRHVKNIPRGDIPTLPNPQAADPPHVAVPISEDVNPGAPRSQQMDDWDIVKAIVYGGLVELVTSFSVVSAAASSGAKTLDIFILGIANLIGGFPLIFHNIADLRDIRDLDVDDERVGHYWLQLGRRSKARLHMVLALLSYMVFGLLPPVLYGLSFRESNDRENRMMAVAGASLACIALLALGKAHVKTAPRTYFKTLVYYLTIAVSSSGLSYVAGVLITRLLGHFGVIEQGGASAPPAPPGLSSPFPHAVGAQSSAWASF